MLEDLVSNLDSSSFKSSSPFKITLVHTLQQIKELKLIHHHASVWAKGGIELRFELHTLRFDQVYPELEVVSLSKL